MSTQPERMTFRVTVSSETSSFSFPLPGDRSGFAARVLSTSGVPDDIQVTVVESERTERPASTDAEIVTALLEACDWVAADPGD